MPIISNIMYKWALLIVTVMSVNTDRVTALSPAPSPEADCTTLVYNMSDCLTYVEKGSNVSKPDKACCPELGEMLDTKPVCLCQLLGKSKDFPVELDVNRALDLPHVCGFSTPSASLCSGIAIGGPAAEPTSSQEPSSSSSSSTDEEAGESSAEKNGSSSICFSQIYYVASLAMVLTSFFL